MLVSLCGGPNMFYYSDMRKPFLPPGDTTALGGIGTFHTLTYTFTARKLYLSIYFSSPATIFKHTFFIKAVEKMKH